MIVISHHGKCNRNHMSCLVLHYSIISLYYVLSISLRMPRRHWKWKINMNNANWSWKYCSISTFSKWGYVFAAFSATAMWQTRSLYFGTGKQINISRLILIVFFGNFWLNDFNCSFAYTWFLTLLNSTILVFDRHFSNEKRCVKRKMWK